jgi:hypothetical protein
LFCVAAAVLRRRSARPIGSEYLEHTIVVQACVAE